MRISFCIDTLHIEREDRTTCRIVFFVLIAYPSGKEHLRTGAEIRTKIEGEDRAGFLRTIGIQRKAGCGVGL